MLKFQRGETVYYKEIPNDTKKRADFSIFILIFV